MYRACLYIILFSVYDVHVYNTIRFIIGAYVHVSDDDDDGGGGGGAHAAVVIALLFESGGVTSVAFKIFLAAQCAQQTSIVLSRYCSTVKERKASNMASLAMMMKLISICLFSFAIERGRLQVGDNFC